MAPELLEGKPVTPAADIFSLGAIVYELCAHKLPFDGANSTALVKNIRTATVPAIPLCSDRDRGAALYSPQLWRLIQEMLSANPKERPTSIGLL